MTNIKIKLDPFPVPSHVTTENLPSTRQEGWQDKPKFELKNLEPEALAELCDNFREAVFKRAGKLDPAKKS